MKPLIYGYLRTDLTGGRTADVEGMIRAFADREGFDLGTIFIESDNGRAAFAELIHELCRAGARDVVVPSMIHVWGRGTSRQSLVARLWHEARAGVWVAGAETDEEDSRWVDDF